MIVRRVAVEQPSGPSRVVNRADELGLCLVIAHALVPLDIEQVWVMVEEASTIFNDRLNSCAW